MAFKTDKAISDAIKINLAVEGLNAGCKDILNILKAHQEDQSILLRAPYIYPSYGAKLSDTLCPECHGEVRVKMRLESVCTPEIKLEFLYGDWFTWRKHKVSWALECVQCGLRTSNCSTLEEAVLQWKKFGFLNLENRKEND